VYRFLEELHAEDPIDVVEFTEGGDFWHAWRAPFPYLVHLHGSRYTFRHMSGRPVGTADWLHRWLELLFIRRAEWVVAPSQALLDIVEEESGESFERSLVIPYPLDPRLLRRPSSIEEPKEEKIVLFAARNDPVKGADILLDAVPLVRQEVPEATFWMFGYKPDERTKLPEGVLCHDFVPKEELLQRYHQADLCVVPSRWDNSPNTVYEAMAAGKAVVASRVGGIPEIVAEGRSGLLVPPGSSEALVQAIIAVLSDKDKCVHMGSYGRKRIQRLAELETNVNRRLKVYHQIVEEFRESVE
jgi:glycosyltransferase involved in cell wall biosynthesis